MKQTSPTLKIIMIFSAALLVLTEVLVLGLSGAWAVAGIFNLSSYVSLAIEVSVLLFGLWISWKFFISAKKAEWPKED